MSEEMLFGYEENRHVAQVLVDVSLPHLNFCYDYEIPEALIDDCVVGCRVLANFSGRLVSGFVVGLATSSAYARLAPVKKVISCEPVLAPGIISLLRAVADYYCGTAADVVRLAIPPRHATTEKAAVTQPSPCVVPTAITGPLTSYPTGTSFLDALARGASPRAAWTYAAVAEPIGDWVAGLLQATAATLQSQRSALLLVPDHRAVTALAKRAEQLFGREHVVILAHDQGEAARYRAFLAAARGTATVVIGTRAATYAPLPQLGLIALLDDGDDHWSEPHAPYPHSREISCLRVGIDGCALLVASPARTPEIQHYIDSGWLGELSLTAGQRRQHCPVVRAATAAQNRLPHEVFVTLQAGLASGPVLVQVPHAGRYRGLLCQSCRERIACPTCGTSVVETIPGTLSCSSCGWAGTRESWHCHSCSGSEIRAVVVGATRQVDELKIAFPGVPVLLSAAGTSCPEVTAEPCIVVATPGAEPPAATGYAAAVLLDADASLSRPDLRAAEESLRRWSAAVSLVRGPANGGSVVIVGDPIARAVQALVRHDPVDFAKREIEERDGALLPPQAGLIAVEGSAAALGALQAKLILPQGAEAFGPLPFGGGDEQRILIKMTPSQRRSVAASLHAIIAEWSQHKDPYLVRIRVDPIAV